MSHSNLNKKLTSPSNLFAYLEEIGAKPRKDLSQNFLIDENILCKIVDGAKLNETQTIVEIGPGPGALTQKLLLKGLKVIAIETDNLFAKALQDWNHPNLTVIHGDAMEFEPEEHNLKNAKIVANIPYHLTGPLLAKFLPMNSHFDSITFLMQKEVATRITAKPNDTEYSGFTLLTEVYSVRDYLFSVKASSFHPRPKVASGVVHFTLKKPSQEEIEALTVIKAAFQKRRKMLRASLKELSSDIEKTLETVGVDPTIRPQSLSLAIFVKISKQINSENNSTSQ